MKPAMLLVQVELKVVYWQVPPMQIACMTLAPVTLLSIPLLLKVTRRMAMVPCSALIKAAWLLNEVTEDRLLESKLHDESVIFEMVATIAKAPAEFPVNRSWSRVTLESHVEDGTSMFTAGRIPLQFETKRPDTSNEQEIES